MGGRGVFQGVSRPCWADTEMRRLSTTKKKPEKPPGHRNNSAHVKLLSLAHMWVWPCGVNKASVSSLLLVCSQRTGRQTASLLNAAAEKWLAGKKMFSIVAESGKWSFYATFHPESRAVDTLSWQGRLCFCFSEIDVVSLEQNVQNVYLSAGTISCGETVSRLAEGGREKQRCEQRRNTD